jgi:hypothetical protein
MIQVTISIWYIIMLVFAIVYLSVQLYKLHKSYKEMELFFTISCREKTDLSTRYNKLKCEYRDLKHLLNNKQQKDKPNERHYGC